MKPLDFVPLLVFIVAVLVSGYYVMQVIRVAIAVEQCNIATAYWQALIEDPHSPHEAEWRKKAEAAHEECDKGRRIIE